MELTEYVNKKKVESVMNPIRYKDGSAITYDAIKTVLEEKIDEYGIDAKIISSELYSGLFSSDEECLSLVNPNHREDYFKFCIYRKEMGKTCVVEVYSYGQSKNIKREDFAANTRIFDGSGAMGTAAGILRGGAVGAGFAIGSAAVGVTKAGVKAIKKGINTLLLDQDALEKENDWYAAVFDILNEIFC